MPVSRIATLTPCPRFPVAQASGAWIVRRFHCKPRKGAVWGGF